MISPTGNVAPPCPNHCNQWCHISPLPDMPILGSSNSTANKDMMSKIWINGGYSYLIKLKTLWEKKKLLVTSNFSFSHKVFKSCLLLMRQNEYIWSEGLTPPSHNPTFLTLYHTMRTSNDPDKVAF